VVRAITRYDQTALRRERAVTAAATALVAQVQAGCAGGIPSSIANGTARQQGVAFDLVFEGAFDLSIDTLHPVQRPALALLHAFDRVHFSHPAFTRGIHAIAPTSPPSVTALRSSTSKRSMRVINGSPPSWGPSGEPSWTGC
jgi:hypothetical protein